MSEGSKTGARGGSEWCQLEGCKRGVNVNEAMKCKRGFRKIVNKGLDQDFRLTKYFCLLLFFSGWEGYPTTFYGLFHEVWCAINGCVCAYH